MFLADLHCFGCKIVPECGVLHHFGCTPSRDVHLPGQANPRCSTLAIFAFRLLETSVPIGLN